MDRKLIIEGKASIEDLIMLSNLGYKFLIEDGKITEIEEVKRDKWEVREL